ncbi:MAG: FAD-dependent oxidoreductase [Candidatus Lokiarchaeota archaeon]|nr:FAD-dependent oxidoreductase [Candidatus Lokiarchaeota archaeon]
MVKEHDILIIGAGLSGLRSAIELVDDYDVAVLSKVHPLRSHSVAAQGGINAAIREEDSWRDHAYDTIKGSDFLADHDTVELLTKEAPRAVIENEQWGTVFSRTEDGRLAQRPFGGQRYPRTCYAADRTGHNLLHTTFEQALRKGVKIYDEWFVTSIVTERDRAIGLTALQLASGKVEGFAARALVVATGGYGRVYKKSTNSIINTGDGIALALRAGASLKDMEFVQFHPTTLAGTSESRYSSNILITEGARGEGAYLINSKGKRFMHKYAPEQKELAERDVVSRGILTEIKEGRGLEGGFLHLDLTHLGAEKIKERLPGIREIAMTFAGIDPIEEPIPVEPAHHYSMGGIDCDRFGRSPLEGLYAVGECSCMSVHGANRLGGNSLLETLVFGRIVGETIAEDFDGLDDTKEDAVDDAAFEMRQKLQRLMLGERGEPPAEIRDELNETMDEKVGVFRNGDDLEKALSRIKELKSRFNEIALGDMDERFNYTLIRTLELENLIDVAEAITKGALMRKESRGAHYREDFPERDDEEYLQHSIILRTDEGLEVDYRDVTLGLFEVED